MRVPSHVESALLLAKVDYRESDVVVTALTPALGRVSALARGARNSQRRFAGGLEPMHTLTLTLDERPSSELMILREARIARARTKLITRLHTLETAGKALSWVRHSVRHGSSEPELFEACERLLDQLNEPIDEARARLLLAEFGLFLLAALGFGLRLTECVVCGKACAEDKPALVDARRGGLVCRGCGGAYRRLEADQRRRLHRASSGEANALEASDAEQSLDLIEQALKAHVGFGRA